MSDVVQIAQEIVNREGGYSNDPDDPGGPTKFGVTIGRMKDLGMDLTGDGTVTAEDVQALKREQAVEIFIKHYFERPRIDALPPLLHATVFDMMVNSGSNAVRILQKLLGDMGFSCTADGQIGPQTIEQASQAARAAPDHLKDAYGIARRNYYYAIADRRAASRKYARRRDGGKGGWIKRAEEFMDSRFWYSRAEHDARVAKWG